MFEILDNHPGSGRRVGRLKTQAGAVMTPTFMPVATRGSLKSLPMNLLETTGVGIILANTYHLALRPGTDAIESLGGLHKFMVWPGPILTDSGGFQIFSLGRHRRFTDDGVEFTDPVTGDRLVITPEDSIRWQLQLGADIIMALDDVPDLVTATPERIRTATERSQRWLERCLVEFELQIKRSSDQPRPLLFGIGQGGLDSGQRRQNLEFIQQRNVDGVAIGGLSVGESKAEMYRVLEDLVPHYDPARPRYLMGVGDPPDLRFAFSRGIDMADCVLPSRNGRHGTVWLSGDRVINLKAARYRQDPRPIDDSCACFVCQRGWSRAWLRHQFKSRDPVAGGLAALHNIHYLQELARANP